MELTLPPKVTDRAFARLAEIAEITGEVKALRVGVSGARLSRLSLCVACPGRGSCTSPDAINFVYPWKSRFYASARRQAEILLLRPSLALAHLVSTQFECDRQAGYQRPKPKE